MRLIQKNLKHTGYVLLLIRKDRGERYLEAFPLFTKDFIYESETIRSLQQEMLGCIVDIDAIYVSDITKPLLDLKEFRKKYNALPRNYVEEIRTGFTNGSGLTQTLPRFVYK